MSDWWPRAPSDTPSPGQASASAADVVATGDEPFIDCPKCHTHNPPSRVTCSNCGHKLLRGRTITERIGFLIAGIVGAGLLGGLAYYLTRATLEGVEIPEFCASPLYVGLAAVAWLIIALGLTFGPTPMYEQYSRRADRHRDISPQQALADLTTALELAPQKQKADILRRRSDLYVKMGRRAEGLEDLSAYALAAEAHASARAATEVSGLPLDSLAEGFTKGKISSLQRTLVNEGQLAAIGYCGHCKDVTSVEERRRCTVCGHKVKDVRYVKPRERTPEAERLLASITRRRRFRLIALSSAIVLVIVAALICEFADVFEPRARPSPPPATSPPTPRPEPSPERDIEAPQFTTFDEDVFSFEYPADWEVITEEDIPILLRGTLKGLEADQARYIGGVYTGRLDDCAGCAQIVLVVLQDEDIEGEFTDEQYAAFRDASEQSMGSRLLSHRYVVTGGLPGAESIHIGASEQTKLWALIVVPPEPGVAYSLSCSALKEEYDDFESVFAHAYETLRFAGVEIQEEPPPREGATPTVVAPTIPTITTEPTADVTGCRLFATFQEDLTVPDGTRFEAGESFTKTWRVRNTGSCPWGPGYHLTFIDGNQMGGPDSVAVPPTEARKDAAISVDLVAPAQPGRYRAVWRICVVGGRCFGDRLTVVIRSID